MDSGDVNVATISLRFHYAIEETRVSRKGAKIAKKDQGFTMISALPAIILS
jgi:hypothetical protein